MTLGKQQELFSSYVSKLLIFAISAGYGVRIGEAQRTIEQQKLYVKTGFSKTLDSQHINKLAIDLYFTKDGKLVYPDEIGAYWESLDPFCKWGGFWKKFVDKPHFEYRQR